MVRYEREEEFVDDRPDTCGLRWFEVHEQIVAHQIERHGEHGGRDPFQVDLAAVVGAPVEHGLAGARARVATDPIVRRASPTSTSQPRLEARRGREWCPAGAAGQLRGRAAADRTLVLLRPDGYVGLISAAGDASAVSDYFAAIGAAVVPARARWPKPRRRAAASR